MLLENDFTPQSIVLNNCLRENNRCWNNNCKQKRSLNGFENSKRAPDTIFGIYVGKQ